MYSSELKYQIGLTLIKGIGNMLAKNLVAYVGCAEAVFREKRQALAKIPGIGEMLSREIVRQEVLARAEEEVLFIDKNGIKPYYFADKDYPFRLKECPDAPVVLFSKGGGGLNDGKFVGIVGTRNATDTGKENCRNLVAGLASIHSRTTIVSGLAYGIDICAHKTALESGLPTIGVLGHGLDRLYPAAHRPAAVKMLADGLLLTEYLSGTSPDRQNFVQRNRIIAGLCDAVVVVESGAKGGSLITAVMANDYNRDVFAFPGRVGDEFSAGCNTLIKKNQASLIESGADVIRFMNWDINPVKTAEAVQPLLFADLSDEETELLSTLCRFPDGIQVNEIAIALGKPFSKISSLLLTMEFGGLVKCLPGGIYKALR
jgi:DNA processing protein